VNGYHRQYYFGSELVVAPYTAPRDPHTGLSRQVVWLPAGDWFDSFTGQHYPGDTWHALHGALDEVPVFARAGAIVPLGTATGDREGRSYANPARLTVHVFPGADKRRFTLYEDDGETTAYQRGAYALTALLQTWEGVSLSTAAGTLLSRRDRAVAACRKLLRAFKLETDTKSAIDEHLPEIVDDVRRLADYWVNLHPAQVRALVEVIAGAGVTRFAETGERDVLVLWNNRPQAGMRYLVSAAGKWSWTFHSEQGVVPRFMPLDVPAQFGADDWELRWKLSTDYFGLTTVTFGHEAGT